MSPRGHRLPFPILAGTSLLMTVLLLLSTATGQEADDYYLPPGPNPLRFLGFASGKTQNKLEIELGIVMKGTMHEAVEIWATLQINDTTYVPGLCPNKDDKEESIAKYEDGALSLSFFFGRPGDFTTTYLKIETPNRFYSLSTLSGKILFANKDRTLKLALQNDSENEFVWANSSLTERRSFLHFMVNQTLQNALRRVTQSDRILDGDVFIRDTSHQTGFDYPYLFGMVDKYLRCASNEFPSDTIRRNYTEQYNTSFCSGWYSVEEDNYTLKVTASVFLYAEYFVVAISISILLVNTFGYGLWSFLVTPKNIDYKESERFPRFLYARQVIFGNAPECIESSSENSPLQVGSSTPQCGVLCVRCLSKYKKPILIFIGVVAFIVAFMLLLVLSSYHYYYSNYNVADMESASCWKARAYWKAVSITTILAFYLLIYSGLVFFRIYKKDNILLEGWLVGLLIVYSVGTGFFLAVMFVNVLIIACYTLAGLVFFHVERMLLLLTGAIVVVHEILKVGVINVTISPEIVKCKAAVDAANSKLQAKEWKRARTSTNKSRSKKSIRQLQREDLHVFAILRLSAEHTDFASEDGQWKRFLERCCCKKKTADSEDSADSDSDAKKYGKLAGEIRYRFWKHLLSSIGLATAAIFVLGNVQSLLVHFGALTGLKDYTKLVLPTSITFKYLGDFAKSQFLSANPPSPDKHLLQQAETIQLTLAEDLPDLPSTTDSADNAHAEGGGGSIALLPVMGTPPQATGGARSGYCRIP